jgi:hypothetical protein
MKNLFERLKDKPKHNLQNNPYINISDIVIEKLKNTDSIYSLDLNCILYLNVLNMVNSYNPIDINNIFNK